MSSARPVIGILRTGAPPADLADRFPDYADMVMAALGEAFDYRVWDVRTGDFPSGNAADAFVLTGSDAHAYDPDGWIEDLKSWLRGADRPLVGICFGHQIMADALGGDVRKSEKGWGLGRHVYAVKSRPAPIGSSTLPEFAIACSHQDQVIVPPPDAETFLSSDFTPHAGLAYRNGAAMSLQPHPEFEDDYTLALAELRRGKAPDATIETALASISRASDSREIAGYLGAFLKRGR